MTILEAAIQVLRDRKQPMSVADIYESIVNQSLYTFGAKSPRSVLSGTLRNHVKKSPSPQVVETSPGSYSLSFDHLHAVSPPARPRLRGEPGSHLPGDPPQDGRQGCRRESARREISSGLGF